MITNRPKTHHGSKVVGMIDHLSRAKMNRRLYGRNDAVDGTVADVEAVGTPEYMTGTYPVHLARIH
jgi:hypothetical protein